MVLAAAAAALAIFAVFQAAFQNGEIAVIKNNILLQKETGWPIVGCAVGIVGSVCLYRLDRRRATIWAVLMLFWAQRLSAPPSTKRPEPATPWKANRSLDCW